MVNKKAALIDAMAIVYRSYYAFLNMQLKNREGIPTSTLYGFATTLFKFIDFLKPDYIGVAWDTSKPTFRHKMDKSYKQNRPPVPDDIIISIPFVKEMLSCMNIYSMEMNGYEADDIIGSMSTELTKHNIETYILSSDKDFMQLVNDWVKIYKPINKQEEWKLINHEEVINYFNVSPEHVIDVLAIMGDASDNIKGVKGIGIKGASKLVNHYGSLEKILDNIDNIPLKSHQNALKACLDDVILAKRLVTIDTSFDHSFDYKNMIWHGLNTKKLDPFLLKMDFQSLHKKIHQNPDYLQKNDKNVVENSDLFATSTQPSIGQYSDNSMYKTLADINVEYVYIDSMDKLRSMIDYLKEQPILCFDTETDGRNPINGGLVGIALSSKKHHAYYIPYVDDCDIEKKEVRRLLNILFANENTVMIAHNAKFDLMVLKHEKIDVQGPIFDTMVTAQLIDRNQRLKLDRLAEYYLGYSPIPITELIGSSSKQKSMKDIDPKNICNYACEDADVTLQLYEHFLPLLKQHGLLNLCQNIENPLVKVLTKMECCGIHVDKKLLDDYAKKLKIEIDEEEQHIHHIAGISFNVNSPKKLGEILFSKLGLKNVGKTKTGQFSTSERALMKLKNEHEIVKHLLRYRMLSKLRSTYTYALTKMINPITHRIHTEYSQTNVLTGRLSSSHPNLQNIPIRTDEGRYIRAAFIAAEGHKLLSADYSQIELRVLAALSKDKNMTQAFHNQMDIHTHTAMELYNLTDANQVTREHRRKAKEVNFGIPYGVSVYGLSNQLDIPRGEAKEMIDRYFIRYPSIRAYIENQKEIGREKGYVETFYGRKCPLNTINSRNAHERSFAERVAVNASIQGTASEIIKKAMIDINAYLEQKKSKACMILQVHDELVFEIPDGEIEEITQPIITLMESAINFGVPLKAEYSISDSWLHLK